MKGTVKRLVKDRGFGFLKDTSAGNEYFFHRTALEQPSAFESMAEGDVVEFDEDKNQTKGPRATNVRVS